MRPTKLKMPTQTPPPPPTPAPQQAEMWQRLLACSIGPLGPSVSSSRVLPGLAGTEGKMNLLEYCQGRSAGLPLILRLLHYADSQG